MTTKEKIDENLRVIGEGVRTLRKDAGLSQDKLAELSGYSRKTINEVERGISNYHYETLVKICEVLRTQVETVLKPI